MHDLRSDDAVLADVAARLKRHRLDQNVTQADLAAEAGVSVPTIQRLEAGASVQWLSLVRVLRALGLLHHVDALVPAPRPRPLELLERDGKRRQRASGTTSTEDAAPWTWED